MDFRPMIAPLFVPATRPERIAKAAASGADAIIIDLEDAVPPDQKNDAREGLHNGITHQPVPVFVRINAVASPWFDDDVALVRSLNGVGVMLPKTESTADLLAVGDDIPVIGLVESARGILALGDICQAPNLRQLAFGSIDYALDAGCEETRDALLLARLSLVTHSRANDLAAPLDGVTVSVGDTDVLSDDAAYARRLGFGGKLAIHPNQIDGIAAAFQPSKDEVDWAQRICDAQTQSGGGAVLVDGQMVDAPVIKKAKQIIAQQTKHSDR